MDRPATRRLPAHRPRRGHPAPRTAAPAGTGATLLRLFVRADSARDPGALRLPTAMNRLPGILCAIETHGSVALIDVLIGTQRFTSTLIGAGEEVARWRIGAPVT